MDEVTQQNSALVEENAATAKTLESQAKSMDDQVSFFRLRDGSGHAAPPRAAETHEHEDVAAKEAPPRKAPAKPVAMSTRQPIAAPRRAAAAGGARRMQTIGATALKDDPEWEEF
jgi:methyl-accepting chemotaxis protein